LARECPHADGAATFCLAVATHFNISIDHIPSEEELSPLVSAEFDPPPFPEDVELPAVIGHAAIV
jgi:hypothetical protein